MKPLLTVTIGAEAVECSGYELVLDLCATGRGFITAKAGVTQQGAVVRIDIGYNNYLWRWFTGFVVSDQPAANGFRRMMIREMSGIFEPRWPLSMQHPTLRQVAAELTRASGVTIQIPDVATYADKPIPHLTHSGTGWQLLDSLGRLFSIQDYIWQQLPDGVVWLGGWEASRFSGLPVEVPSEYASSVGGGNSMTAPLIPTVRPGVVVNGHRITRVAVKDGDMTLTWLPPGLTPKNPLQRQIEQLNPEIAAGLHLPKFARVENYTEAAALGDIADPFRPKYAVGVQLIDGTGENSTDTPAYPAVPLPIGMGGDESGFMQYPPPGTLVEIAFQEGRQDRPYIRQVLPTGSSLPAIKPGEQLQQQRAEVFQRVQQDGSWHRETDQAIAEVSASRHVQADTETRNLIDRKVTIRADDSKTVLGTTKTTAGAITHISKGDHTIGTGGRVNVSAQAATEKVVADKTVEVGASLTERVAGLRKSISAGLELQSPTVRIGNGELNILTLLLETLDVVSALAQATATHQHPDTGAPSNPGAFNALADQTVTLKDKYDGLIG
ncbi:hypothetical protein [Buttiauxella brennerae]|uniref:hypothetical protein n=1 Tax=Buttiauxella brennerae TaxID=82988 RepID=UPI00286F05DD|nr:hypothetical protein [Buttiauxella brennerae]